MVFVFEGPTDRILQGISKDLNQSQCIMLDVGLKQCPETCQADS